MATVKVSYASSTTILCSVAALASGTNQARFSSLVDNATNLYSDALLYVAVKVSGTALANDKSVYVYLYGSEDGTSYSMSSREGSGTDVTAILEIPTNLKPGMTISCPGTSNTYRGVTSVAQAFNGVMPRKWGIVIDNFTGQLLDPTESNHTKSYTGITYTVV